VTVETSLGKFIWH